VQGEILYVCEMLSQGFQVDLAPVGVRIRIEVLDGFLNGPKRVIVGGGEWRRRLHMLMGWCMITVSPGGRTVMHIGTECGPQQQKGRTEQDAGIANGHGVLHAGIS
jgi:hypothetical protein